MQKLETRDTYTPTDASQVSGNCDYALNREQTPSVHSLKTVSNNSDENRQSGRTEQDLRVPVLNMRKEPLMPTTPGKARHLLKQDKAKVVSRKPFTIQLNYATGENKQEITLGVDAGYQFVGFSATTKKQELISGEVELRTDIPKKLLERRMYRRNRRSRKWHRQPRFNNRKRDDGWLVPSIRHKLDSHLRIVKKVMQLLPITEIVVEVASFDIQKIKNPDIEGTEYQQGNQLGFWNLREYVLHRDNHRCQHPNCKHKKDNVLVVHHINGRAEGATDRPEELITLHKRCHDDHHSGKNILPKVKIKQFKPETFMTTVRWKLVNQLRNMFPDLDVEYTYGYITKNKRISFGLDKSHVSDAFVISGGRDQRRTKPYSIKQVRRNNRSIQLNRKGFKPSIRRKRYSLQPGDIVSWGGMEYVVKGVFNKGRWVRLKTLFGETVNCNIEKVRLIVYGKGLFKGC